MNKLFTTTMFRVQALVAGAQNTCKEESMKAAKAYIEAGIDMPAPKGCVVHREHMKDLFAVAMRATRIQAFMDALEGVLIDNRTKRIDHAVRVSAVINGRRTVEFGRVDVLTMPRVGDVMTVLDLMFNEYVEGMTIVSIDYDDEDYSDVPAAITPDCIKTPAPSLAKPKTIKRTYAKRKTIVEVAGQANGKTTYRVRMDNGRIYLYTEGHNFAQIKMPGGVFKDTTSEYTLSRIRIAIALM